MRKIAIFYFKFRGWKVSGHRPQHLKYLVIIAPHTSYRDFIPAILIKFYFDIRANFFGKHTLFFWPLGVLMRKLGGIPIDRRASHDIVQLTIDEYLKRPKFALGLTPEGTRKRTEFWKSGFYRIARAAEVPIVPIFLDFGKKEIGIGPDIVLTGDLKVDMDAIREVYRDKVGANPQEFGPIQLQEETSS